MSLARLVSRYIRHLPMMISIRSFPPMPAWRHLDSGRHKSFAYYKPAGPVQRFEMRSSVICLFAFASSASCFVPLSNRRYVPSSRDTQLYSGVERNENFAKLAGGYLFPEIGRRRNAYIAENPDMASRIISLGIGDTTQPIPPHILNGLMQGVTKLGKKETYTGGFGGVFPFSYL